jgi:hypothetical protein
MSAEMIATWCAMGASEIAASSSPAVQSVSEMLQQMNGKLPRLNSVADQLYSRWVKGLSA